MGRALILSTLLIATPAFAQQPAPLTLGQQFCAQRASEATAFEQRLLDKIEQLQAQLDKRKAEDEAAAKAPAP